MFCSCDALTSRSVIAERSVSAMRTIVPRSDNHPQADPMRWCGRCKSWKPEQEFHKGGKHIWCKTCRTQYHHSRKQVQDAELAKDKHLNLQYGITLDDYMEMLIEQKGLCAACGQPETAMMNGATKDLAVDHCHQTGQVRGLLCHACNTALGHLMEDPKRIDALMKYVRQRVLPLKSR